MPYNKHTIEDERHVGKGPLFGSKYSRMGQVKFVEDSL